jgi:hypothetical protein
VAQRRARVCARARRAPRRGPAATSPEERSWPFAQLEDCRPSAAASMTGAALTAITVSSRSSAARLLRVDGFDLRPNPTVPSIGPTDPGRVLAHRVLQEHATEAGSTCPEGNAEGVATSRHRRDDLNLRSFANAVNLSDCPERLPRPSPLVDSVARMAIVRKDRRASRLPSLRSAHSRP